VWVAFASVVVMGCGALIGTVCLVWLWCNRQSAIVKSAQPTFLSLIIVGSVMSLSACIPAAFDHREAFFSDAGVTSELQLASRMCDLQLWLYSLGFILSFSSLLAKLWNIKRLTMSRQISPAAASTAGGWHCTSKLYVAVALAVLMQTLFLVAWTGTSPLEYETTTAVVRGFQVDSNGACVPRGAAPGFLYTFVGLHAAMLLYGALLAYEMRAIPDEYAETKYVAFAIVAHLQTKLIFILAAVFSFSSPLIFYLVKLLTLTASDLGTMLLLIVPKMFVVWSTKDTDAQVKQRMQAAKNKLVHVAIQRQGQSSNPIGEQPSDGQSDAVAVPVVLAIPPGQVAKPPAFRPAASSYWASDAASASARATSAHTAHGASDDCLSELANEDVERETSSSSTISASAEPEVATRWSSIV